MTKISPCPFCRGEAAVGEITYPANSETAKLHGQTTFYFVNCIFCGSNNQALSMGYKTEEEAITAWNRRVDERFIKLGELAQELLDNHPQVESEFGATFDSGREAGIQLCLARLKGKSDDN